MSSKEPLVLTENVHSGHGHKTKSYMTIDKPKRRVRQNKKDADSFSRQMRAMLHKNIVLQKRFIVGTICECLFPIILILISCVYVLLFKDALDIDGASYSK